jgi:chromosome segregation ATPase
LSDAHNQLGAVKEALAAHEERSKLTQAQLKTLELKGVEQSALLDGAKQLEATLREQLDEQRLDHVERLAQIDAARKDAADAKQELAERRATIAQFEAKDLELGEKLTSSEQERDQLLKQLENLAKAEVVAEQKIKGRGAELLKERNALRERLKAFEREIGRAKKDLDRNRDQIKRGVSLEKKLKAQLAAAAQERDHLGKQLQETEKRHTRGKQRFEKQSADLEKARKGEVELRRRLADADRIHKELNTKTEKLLRDRKEHTRRIAELEVQAGSIQGDALRTEGKQRKQLSEVMEDRDQLRRRVMELEAARDADRDHRRRLEADQQFLGEVHDQELVEFLDSSPDADTPEEENEPVSEEQYPETHRYSPDSAAEERDDVGSQDRTELDDMLDALERGDEDPDHEGPPAENDARPRSARPRSARPQGDAEAAPRVRPARPPADGRRPRRAPPPRPGAKPPAGRTQSGPRRRKRKPRPPKPPSGDIPDAVLDPKGLRRTQSFEGRRPQLEDVPTRRGLKSPGPAPARQVTSGGTELAICCEPLDPADGEPHEPIPLAVGQVLIVGRSVEGAQLVLPSAKVSRQHATIERTPLGVTIQDMQSRNGTFLGDEKLGKDPIELSCGKSVLIGGYRLVLSGRNAAQDRYQESLKRRPLTAADYGLGTGEEEETASQRA